MNNYSSFNEQPRPEVPPEGTTGFGYPQQMPMPQQAAPSFQQIPLPQQQGYGQPMAYPQQQGYGQPMAYPQQPMQPMYPQQPMMPQQGYGQPMQVQYPQQVPMGMPYPQQQMMYLQQPMMMPQQPINLVVNNVNNNTSNATAMAGIGLVGVVKMRNTPLLLSIIYFFFIGCWLGFYWVIIGFILSALGTDIGRKMMSQLPMVFFLRQPMPSMQPVIYR